MMMSNKYLSNKQEDEHERDFVASSFEDEETQSAAVQDRFTKKFIRYTKKEQEEKVILQNNP